MTESHEDEQAYHSFFLLNLQIHVTIYLKSHSRIKASNTIKSMNWLIHNNLSYVLISRINNNLNLIYDRWIHVDSIILLGSLMTKSCTSVNHFILFFIFLFHLYLNKIFYKKFLPASLLTQSFYITNFVRYC